MPPSLAAASASLLTRAWLCAVTIRSVFAAISDAGDDFRVGLYHHLDTGGSGGCRQPVFTVVNDDPRDVDAAFAQHIESRHAEMAGADEGDPHKFKSVIGETDMR